MFGVELPQRLEILPWHFRRDCSQWPNGFNIIIAEYLRPDSELCTECLARDQQRSAELHQDL